MLYRGQIIAEKLAHNGEEVVKALGFKDLYLRTEHTYEYYKKLGWEVICKIHDKKG